MTTVFVTRTLPGTALQQLSERGYNLDLWEGDLPPPPETLRERAAAADAVLALLTDRFDTSLLEAAPRLRVIANMAVGYDNVDPAEAEQRGIWLTNTPGVLAETTADFTFALLLAAARRVAESDRDTRAGGWKTWSPTGFLGPDVHRATLGIVGLGEIGAAVARRARGLGMRLLATSRTSRPERETELGVEHVPLEELLRQSDFVSLHTPLTAETRHLLGAREFEQMKQGAILVNTARGGVVDQDALVAALHSGHLGGAALDVTDPEPLPLEHPLFALPNVIITPHIASASLATRARMAEMAAENIIAVLEGRTPPNPVNRPANPRGGEAAR